MNVTQRRYEGVQDQPRMAALVHADLAANLRVCDLPYRLSSWAFDYADNVGLWVDDKGALVAWAVLQTPFWTIDCTLHPDAPSSVHQSILAWADQRAGEVRGTSCGRPMWFIMVFSDQQQRIADLEAEGWACQVNVAENPWSKVFMVRSVDINPAAPKLPTDFTIRPLAGPSEVAAYVTLHHAVFESESMTEAWRQRTLSQAAYRPDLDLVVVAPDGRLAAFCVCWFDALGPTGRPCGQIEPLGVHADFRGRGIGHAILEEGVQRLREHGAQDIMLETDSYRDNARSLYERAGFRVTRDVLIYRKEYPPTLKPQPNG